MPSSGRSDQRRRRVIRRRRSHDRPRRIARCALIRPTPLLTPVIPAQAGIQSGRGGCDVRCWTPAFAGVTECAMPGTEDPAGGVAPRCDANNARPDADHGMHGTAHSRHSSASWNPVRPWRVRCPLPDPGVRRGCRDRDRRTVSASLFLVTRTSHERWSRIPRPPDAGPRGRPQTASCQGHRNGMSRAPARGANIAPRPDREHSNGMATDVTKRSTGTARVVVRGDATSASILRSRVTRRDAIPHRTGHSIRHGHDLPGVRE